MGNEIAQAVGRRGGRTQAAGPALVRERLANAKNPSGFPIRAHGLAKVLGAPVHRIPVDFWPLRLLITFSIVSCSIGF